MHISANWQGGYKFFCYNEKGHQTVMDADPETHGETDGPIPVEAYMEALAACGGIDILVILKKRRINVTKFNIELEAERRNTLPKIFTNIKMDYIISGDGLNDKEMSRAVKFSEEKLCTVLAMIDKRNTTVELNYKIL